MHPKQRVLMEGLREQSRRIAEGQLVPDAIALLRRQSPHPADDLFLLSHIPDQGEDYYIFVSSSNLVYEVEIPRNDGALGTVEVMPLAEFRQQRRGRLTNRKLDAIKTLLSERKA